MTIEHKNIGSGAHTEICCDECGSYEIDNSSGEYVCTTCGLVLNIQRLDYNTPFKQEKLRHEILSTTQIGFKYERKQSKFSRMEKIQRVKSTDEVVKARIRHEVNRIINKLSLPGSHKQALYQKVQEIRNSLTAGTKYRNPDKLIPMVLYLYMKYNSVSVDKQRLIEIAKVDKKEFHNFLTTIVNFFPIYDRERKMDYVKQRIMKVTEELTLGMGFYFLATDVLYKFWNAIKNTKEDVIAGLACSVAALCDYRGEVSVSSICRKVNIQMSTVQARVERHFFDRFSVPGFESLVKSADLLQKIILKLGIPLKSIEPEELEHPAEEYCGEEERGHTHQKESERYPEIVLLRIKELSKEYSTRYKRRHVHFAVKDGDDNLVLISFGLRGNFLRCEHQRKNLVLKPIELHRSRYHEYKSIKGPPSC